MSGKKVNKINLEDIAREVRQAILDIACRSGSAHVGSSLSCVDLLVSLYFGKMKIDPKDWKNRDIFVLSKGHAAMALYCTLWRKGLMSRKTLDGYMQDGGTLPAHLDRFTSKGIEVSSGSLGHGFNIALGMAHSLKLQGTKRQVFAVIGDGESEEGSIWEGALFAPSYGLDNFTVLIDHNNLQGYGRPTNLCNYEPIVDKWKSFGWHVSRVDGHDHKALAKALGARTKGKPKAIVCDTVKGKGVPFMEDEMKWHYYIVTDELRKEAMNALCGGLDEK